MLKPMLLALTLAAVAPTSAAKPPLQIAEMGPKIDPIRMCAVKTVNGKLQMVGDWVPYNSFSGRSGESCLYDCYGRAWGPGSTGDPIGGNTMPCSAAFGLSASSRWYFGGDYYNPNMVEDLTVWNSGMIESINAGLWWLNDPTQSRHLILAFLLSEDPIDVPCSLSPDSNAYPSPNEGVVLDFGMVLGSNTGYFPIDATGIIVLGATMPVNQDGAASYRAIIAEDFDTITGAFTLSSGPCQFMLWGAGTIRNDGLNACGDQTSISYDDDNPTDGVLDAPGECYDNAFGVCPDPLGKMVAYCGATYCCAGICPTNTNSLYSPQNYGISGTASGTPWAWALSSATGGWEMCDSHVPGVTSGGSSLALAEAFANSINTALNSSGVACTATIYAWADAPNPPDATLHISTSMPDLFDLSVGPSGACIPDLCCVCPGPCFFNPQIRLLCPSDFNGDGFVVGDDFDGYVAAFESGDAVADFNYDGFVTGDDFDSFVAAFEVGC